MASDTLIEDGDLVTFGFGNTLVTGEARVIAFRQESPIVSLYDYHPSYAPPPPLVKMDLVLTNAFCEDRPPKLSDRMQELVDQLRKEGK